MSDDLFYQFLVSVFSCAVGFVAGLGVSWKTRRDGDGEPVYTPTLNTSRGMRALFGVIAMLALGSVVLTAIVNDRNRESVEEQTACNQAIASAINARAAVNTADTKNTTTMVENVIGLTLMPAEQRPQGAFLKVLQDYANQAKINDAERARIPTTIDGCGEVPQ